MSFPNTPNMPFEAFVLYIFAPSSPPRTQKKRTNRLKIRKIANYGTPSLYLLRVFVVVNPRLLAVDSHIIFPSSKGSPWSQTRHINRATRTRTWEGK